MGADYVNAVNQDRYQVMERDAVIDRTKVETPAWPEDLKSRRWAALQMSVAIHNQSLIEEKTPAVFLQTAQEIMDWIEG